MTTHAFSYQHLPEHLATVSKRFHDLAGWLLCSIPASPELDAALRHLLESKDAAVRASGGILIPTAADYRRAAE